MFLTSYQNLRFLLLFLTGMWSLMTCCNVIAGSQELGRGGRLSAAPKRFCRYTLFLISPLNAPSLKEVTKTCTKINTLHKQVKRKHNTLLKRKRMHLRIEKVFFIFNSRHFATLPNNRTS